MCVDGQGCCCHRQGRVSIADPPRLWTQTSINAWPLSVSSSSYPTLILIPPQKEAFKNFKVTLKENRRICSLSAVGWTGGGSRPSRSVLTGHGRKWEEGKRGKGGFSSQCLCLVELPPSPRILITCLSHPGNMSQKNGCRPYSPDSCH